MTSRVCASRAPNGSSMRMMAGLDMSARAMPRAGACRRRAAMDRQSRTLDRPTRARRLRPALLGTALEREIVVAVGRELAAEQDVAENSEPRKQAVVLKHHGALDACARQRSCPRPRRYRHQRFRARRRCGSNVDLPQPDAPDDGEELSGIDREADIVENERAAAAGQRSSSSGGEFRWLWSRLSVPSDRERGRGAARGAVDPARGR